MNTSGGSSASLGDAAIFGILTISDRASSGEYVDEGGPAICEFFEEAICSPWKIVYQCVPDEQKVIEAALVELVDEHACDVVVTTGGTGPTPRDITPEATEAVCDKLLPGFGEQMRAISLKFVPTAILSRQIGGIRGSSLIFNLPGRPKAIRETIDEIWKAVPYCIDLLNGPYIECDREVCDDFRPKTARR